MPNFDRFDICEAYACLEADYNVGGWLRERPSNQRRREACAVQLHRMHFKPRPNLSTNTLEENAREIYDEAVIRLGLPYEVDAEQWADVCEELGLDDSFQYTPEQMQAHVRAFLFG